MTIAYKTSVVCDGCKTFINVQGQDSLRAGAAADSHRWRTIVTHYSGLSVHFCPKCAAGKTDEELVEGIG